MYIYDLITEIANTGMGGFIGNINCSAPTCADDITITTYGNIEAQILIVTAVDYSRREAYKLQPTKSVVLPVRTSSRQSNLQEYTYELGPNVMPIVDKATHIGINRYTSDAQITTTEKNIKKARRALYSLMGSGMHGENGEDPGTGIIMFKTYVMPILLYGLEITLVNSKSISKLQSFHKKTIKHILSLPTNTGDPAIYILSGMLPIEAEIEIRAITLLGNILCGSKNTTEWKITERQLKIKNLESNSWFIAMRKICMKYNLQDPEIFIHQQITKSKWKKIMIFKIKKFWKDKILSDKELYSSLKYLSPIYKIGYVLPLIEIQTVDTREVPKTFTQN